MTSYFTTSSSAVDGQSTRMGEMGEEMLAAQSRSFLRWINHVLRDKSLRIQDLYVDLEDGVVLIALLECLAPEKEMPARYYAKPFIKIQKVHNLTVAFKFITEVERISLGDIEPRDIMEKNKSAMHGLIWSLILRYTIKYHPSAPLSQEAAFTATRSLFLTWINCILPDLRVLNFSSDWRDGCTLSAVVNYCSPGSMPNYNSLDSSNSYDNVRNAMNLAETLLHVPQLIDVEHFIAESPDERSILLYLSYFIPYGEKNLSGWIESQLPGVKLSSFSHDWVDGKLLGALMNVTSDGKFEAFAEMSSRNAPTDIEEIMTAAEKILGIQRTATPREFASTSLDRIARLSYLSQFYRVKTKSDTMVLFPPTPDKVRVEQILIPESVGMGNLVQVDLDCSDAGYGRIHAEACSKEAGTLSVTVDAVSIQWYRVTFTPPIVAIYSLSILYGKDHIPGSPFLINLHPPDHHQVERVETLLPREEQQELYMRFDAANAGCGDLKARASGEIAGSVPVRVIPEPNSMYLISLVPPLPDLYTVDVLWGKSTTGTVGENLTNGPHLFQDGRLLLWRPSGKDDSSPHENWDGSPILGSPFTIDLLPPGNPGAVECTLPLYTVPGEEAEVFVDTTNAGSGELKAYCICTGGGEIRTDVTRPAKREYLVTFIPRNRSLYKLYITFGDEQVPQSPIIFDLSPGKTRERGKVDESLYMVQQPQPEKCVLKKLPRSAAVNRPITFTVDAQKAGDGEVNVSVSEPTRRLGQREKPAQVTKLTRRLFKVEFVPKFPGEHRFVVRWSGREIPGSPFRVEVLDEIITFAPTLTNAEDLASILCLKNRVGRRQHVQFPRQGKSIVTTTDKAAVLVIKARREEDRNGRLVATVTNTTTGQRARTDVLKERDEFEVSFSPPEPGLYTVDVKLNGKQVPNTPVGFKYEVPPPNASECKVLGLEDHPSAFQANKKIRFQVDTRLAGDGKFSIKADAPKGESNWEAKLNPRDKHFIDVTYTPSVPGTHKVRLYWSGKQIPKSPLSFKVHAIPEFSPGKMITYDLQWIDVGEGDLHCVFSLEGSKACQEGKVRKLGKNKYNFSFQPTEPGLYALSVYLWGKETLWSPVLIRSASTNGKGRRSDSGRSFSLGPMIRRSFSLGPLARRRSSRKEIRVPVGEELKLTIIPRNDAQRDGELVARVNGEETGPGVVEKGKDNEGRFLVRFNPPQPDHYVIVVELNGEEVGSSPYYVHYYLEEQPSYSAASFPRDEPDAPLRSWRGRHLSSPRVQGIEGRRSITKDSKEVRIPIGKELELRIRPSDEAQRKGILTARVIGELSGPGKADVSQDDQGVFQIKFNPSKPDHYVIVVKLDGVEVASSPYHIHYYLTPSRKSLPGVAADPYKQEIRVPVGKETKLTVVPKNEEQRRGRMIVTVNGRETGPGEVDVSQSSNGVFMILFNPSKPDHYVMVAELNGEEVGTSPYYIHYYLTPGQELMSARARESFPRESFSQKEAPWEHELDVSHKSGKLTAVCNGIVSGEVPVNIQESSPGSRKYKLKIHPEQPDLYYITVKLDEREIENSPFRVDLRQPETTPGEETGEELESIRPWRKPYIRASPPRIEVEEVSSEEEPHSLRNFLESVMGTDESERSTKREIRTHVGTELKIRVVPRDEEQRNGKLTVRVNGRTTGPGKADVSQDFDGVFLIRFNSSQPDHYVIVVELNGEEVTTSPYFVHYYQTGDERRSLTPYWLSKDKERPSISPRQNSRTPDPSTAKGEMRVPIGEELKLTVVPKNDVERFGKLTTRVLGKDTGLGEANVSQDDGVFQIRFYPSQPDHYVIVAQLNGEEVSSSPYYVHYYLPLGDRHSLSVSQPDYGRFQSPKGSIDSHKPPWEYELDASEEPGKLTAVAYGIQFGEIPVIIHESRPGSRNYKLEIHPEQPDLYYITVKLGEREIKDSPFRVDLRLAASEVDEGEEFESIRSRRESRRFSPRLQQIKDEEIEEPDSIKNLLQDVINVFDIEEPTTQRDIRVRLGTEVKLTIIPKNEAQRNGKLSVRVTGRSTGPGEVDITQDNEGVYVVKYNPRRADYYVMVVKMNGEEIGSSPYTFHYYLRSSKERSLTPYYLGKDKERSHSPWVVRYKQPAQPLVCKVINFRDCIFIGDDMEFLVDAKEAGDGELAVNILGPDRRESALTSLMNNRDGTYTISLTPSIVGDHKVYISWSEEPIPRSPLHLSVRDLPYAELTTILHVKDKLGNMHNVQFPRESRKPVVITAYETPVLVIKTQTEEQRNGQLAATVINTRTRQRPHVNILKETDEFEVSFKPPEPGVYTVDAHLNGKQVPNIPVNFKYIDPDSRTHEDGAARDGREIRVPFGEAVDLRIEPRNEAERNGKITIKVNEKEPRPDEVKVSQDDDGVFLVEYKPQPGHYVTVVELNGKEVSTSPYYIYCYIMGDVHEVDFSYLPPWEHELDFSKRPGKLAATCRGVSCGEIPVSIDESSPGSGKHKLRIQPAEPDLYYITVKLDEKEIETSPIRVDLRKLAEDEYPEIPPWELELDFSNTPDKLTATCRGVNCGEIPVAIHECSPGSRKYKLQIRPHQPDLYYITVKLNGREIEKSPFRVDLMKYAAKRQPAMPAQTSTQPKPIPPYAPDQVPVKVRVQQREQPKTEEFKIAAAEVKKRVAKPRILNLSKEPTPLGYCMDLEIDASDSGSGTLKVKQRGEGRADIKFQSKGDGLYMCSINPIRMGICVIDITMNDESIEQCPFTHYFCGTAGVSLEGKTLQVGTVYTIDISCSEVYEGELEISCGDDDPDIADTTLARDADTHTYKCTILPKREGQCFVTVKYNGFHVIGSPFNVQFVQPSNSVIFSLVSPLGMEVRASEVSANMETSTQHQEVPVNITQLPEGQFSLDFVPTQEECDYLLTIRGLMTLKRKEVYVEECMLHYTTRSAPASGLQCSVEGEGIVRGEVGSWNRFTVLAEEGKIEEISAVFDDANSVTAEHVVTTILPCVKYEVKYLATKSGTFKIYLTSKGKPITECPYYEVTCFLPEEVVLVEGMSRFPTTAEQGKPFQFSFKPRVPLAGESLQVTAYSKSFGFVMGSYGLTEDGYYHCTVLLEHHGKYLIEVKCNSKAIEGTPFEVNVPMPDVPEMSERLLGQERSITESAGVFESQDTGGQGRRSTMESRTSGGEVDMYHRERGVSQEGSLIKKAPDAINEPSFHPPQTETLWD